MDKINKKMKKLIIKILRKLIRIIEIKPQTNIEEGSGFLELFGKSFYYHFKLAFDITYDEIFRKGIYTFWTTNERPIIIDCGANMGLSLLFFSLNYPNAKIYAFEPDETVLGCLEKNISNYQMMNVELFKQAVWNANEELEFFTDKGMGGRLENNYKNQIPTKIKAIRLKDFISDKHVDFLKMDIEGAEYTVIQDCEPILNQIKNIFIEYHSMENEEQKLDDLLLILKRNGFRYHLTQSFSRARPFVDQDLTCEKIDMAINVFGYK